jgi:hypothetical protein
MQDTHLFHRVRSLSPNMASSGDNTQLLFHWSDYLVFILSLVISGSVGVIQGVVDMIRKKKKTTHDEESRVSERDISGQ